MTEAGVELRKVEGEGAPLRLFAYAAVATTLLLFMSTPKPIVGLFAAVSVIPAIASYARAVRQRNGDEDPKWMKAAPGTSTDRRAAGQRLAGNPFEAAGADAPVAERITKAAELCVGFGRRAIVLSLKIDSFDPSDVHRVADLIRDVVRHTDMVEPASDREILVGLAMVHDFGAADIVTDRIERRLYRENKRLVAKGAAIYPLHGYSGEELIAAARKHTRATVPLLPR
jgi:hypothetical protein